MRRVKRFAHNMIEDPLFELKESVSRRDMGRNLILKADKGGGQKGGFFLLW
jgi:hypothetical protein